MQKNITKQKKTNLKDSVSLHRQKKLCMHLPLFLLDAFSHFSDSFGIWRYMPPAETLRRWRKISAQESNPRHSRTVSSASATPHLLRLGHSLDSVLYCIYLVFIWPLRRGRHQSVRNLTRGISTARGFTQTARKRDCIDGWTLSSKRTKSCIML